MYELLFLLGRVLFGGFFILNALNHFTKTGMIAQYAGSKKVPSPKYAVWLSGLFILFGGLGILLGVQVQYAVSLLVIFLAVVSLTMHNFWAIQDPMQKQMEMIQFLKNMALLGAALMALAIPQPWAYRLAL
jgi:uncharacterized membrane protein YphA (DoxX/SURF4 family)